MDAFENAMARGELDLGSYATPFETVEDLADYLLAPENRTTYPCRLLYEDIVDKVGVTLMYDAESLIRWLMPQSSEWEIDAMHDAIFTLTAKARLIIFYEGH